MEHILRALGLQAHAPAVVMAARFDFIVSLMLLIGSITLAVPALVGLALGLARRRWAEAQRSGFWLLVLLLLFLYCLASVVDGMDTLDLLPQ